MSPMVYDYNCQVCGKRSHGQNIVKKCVACDKAVCNAHFNGGICMDCMQRLPTDLQAKHLKNTRNMTLSWVIPCIIPFALLGVLLLALQEPMVMIPLAALGPVFGCAGFCRMSRRYNLTIAKARGVLGAFASSQGTP